MRALKEAFYRSSLPNITQLMSTIVIFLVVIYFQVVAWPSQYYILSHMPQVCLCHAYLAAGHVDRACPAIGIAEPSQLCSDSSYACYAVKGANASRFRM